MVLTYDVTEYINSAIWLVKQSIAIGGVLATIILLLYLRSRTSTFVIAVAIPISIIGTFPMLYLFGRSLNVISLAGMAFAVGMVVDNSIVVLENIYRHRPDGKDRVSRPPTTGRSEVWGAVLASTLDHHRRLRSDRLHQGRGGPALRRHRPGSVACRGAQPDRLDHRDSESVRPHSPNGCRSGRGTRISQSVGFLDKAQGFARWVRRHRLSDHRLDDEAPRRCRPSSRSLPSG